jgi:hypothetical protein
MVTTITLGAVTIITDTKVRNAKPRDAQYKLTDDRGLCLLIAPNGGKWWRFNYRFDGKQKTLSMGVYPEVTLADARARRDAARAAGICARRKVNSNVLVAAYRPPEVRPHRSALLDHGPCGRGKEVLGGGPRGRECSRRAL